jgi:putative endonuclease
MNRNRCFQPAVYIVANHKGGTIYTGVMSDLPKRAWQHRESAFEGFTHKQCCKRLVWFELHSTMEHAITREKQIKGGSRAKKIALIEATNSEWRDLLFELIG